MNAKRILLVAGLVSALVFPISVQSAVTLTVTPLTWNIIGLDSNKPISGPTHFPVGARVCSSVATTNVTVDFIWDSANPNVALRPGSLGSLTIASIAAGSCADAYFEVEVTQIAAAYDTTRRYHITATDGSGTASTPAPRELYVEHLISQNRNSITDVRFNGLSIPAGGTMSLLVGNTYTIEIEGGTATQGYGQFEVFINLPNTIFQILSVSTTYSADNSPYVPNPNDKLYADACKWENDVSSPNYRSCVGGDFKAGGNTVVTTYTVKILSGGGTVLTLSTLLYDFSGSSFHYNSDFSAGARIASIVDVTSLTISKAFAPSSTVAGGSSTLTFTITNPTSETITGASFSDTLPTSPAAMIVASPPNASTSGCGTPTFAPAAGAPSVSFSNGTLAPNGTCTASVRVTVPSSPTSGTYHNVSNNLFIDAQDTGHHATADLALTTTSAGTGLCGLTLARWNFPTGMSTTAPAATTANVTATAAAGVGLVPIFSSNDNTISPTGTGSWGSNGGVTTGGTLVTSNDEYFEFGLDTTGYSSISLTFDALFRTPNGPSGLAVYFGTSNARPESGIQVFLNATAMSTQNVWNSFGGGGSITFASGLNPSGTTFFRIYTFNSGNTNSGSDVNIDNVLFTGCGAAAQPTIAKSFGPDPIAVNGTSTLTFTLTNPNTAPLTGVKFSDTLPAGLQVAATPAASTTCGGAPSWAPVAGSATLDFGQTTGATVAVGSCTVSVNVTATTSGPHTNVSGFISSTEGGTNSGFGGSATASLTALQPPSISKFFGPNPILTGGTSTLTFFITNPNANNSLPAVSFSDTLPTSPAAMTVAGTPNASATGCGAPILTAVAGAGSISFSNGTIAAGATCTVTVDVTAPVAGDYANTSGIVSTTIAGVVSNGNTASDTLTVRDAHPGIGLLKQVSTTASGPWTTFLSIAPGTSIFYQFTIENTGDVPLSPVSVTDPTVSAAGCTWPASLPVASPTDEPTATCVAGPVAALAGDHPNTATAHGVNGGTVQDSDPSSADYIGAVPGFSLLKQIGTSPTGPWASAISGVAPGSSLYYKFTIVNTGNVPLSGINVTDPQVSTVTCTFTDPLPALNGATICVVGPVAASATIATHPNTATAHGTNDGTTIDSLPSSASYTVASADPDLSITKAHVGTFSQGQVGATYTLTVTNVGLAPTTGLVTVTEVPPVDLTVTGLTGSGWSCDVPTLTCTRSDVLAASGSYPDITVTVTVSAIAPPSVTNVASVSGGGETNTSNNSASDPTTINPASPDLTIFKSHSGNFVQGQTDAVYTVTVQNLGPGSTTGLVTVTETPPVGLTVTGLTGSGWSCDVGLLTCTRSDLLAAPGSYPAITVTVTVALTAPASLTNVASVSGGGETNTGNNSASDPTTINPPSPGPDLTILKSHSGNFVQGQTGVTYLLTVKNVGLAATTGLVTVTETPPAGLTVTGLTGPGWSCDVGLLTCTRSDALAASGSYPAIIVTVTVALTAPASLTNVASVSGGGETNTGNNSASDPTTINPAPPDLTIFKTHSGSFVQGQTDATYAVTVRNLGPGATTGLVTVTETPPAGLTVTGLAGPGWSCDVGLLTCTRSDTLAASASYPAITVTVTVAATAAASVTNAASVSGGGDTSAGNNSASDPTTVDPPSAGPDLTVLKSHSGNFVKGQTGALYILTVRNLGLAATTGLVTVTDALPTGLTATSMEGTGWICVLATLTCTRSDALAAGASYPAITLTVNVASDAAGNLVNTASVSGGGDASPANNTTADGTVVDPPAPIPTLSAWTFTLLAVILFLTAVGAINRRARQSPAQ